MRKGHLRVGELQSRLFLDGGGQPVRTADDERERAAGVPEPSDGVGEFLRGELFPLDAERDERRRLRQGGKDLFTLPIQGGGDGAGIVLVGDPLLRKIDFAQVAERREPLAVFGRGFGKIGFLQRTDRDQRDPVHSFASLVRLSGISRPPRSCGLRDSSACRAPRPSRRSYGAARPSPEPRGRAVPSPSRGK